MFTSDNPERICHCHCIRTEIAQIPVVHCFSLLFCSFFVQPSAKMPSTRSQNQPTLHFPRRKSSRAVARSKSSAQPEPEVLSPAPAVQATAVAAPRPAQNTPLSPRHAALKSAPLSPRLPLSPRKRMSRCRAQVCAHKMVADSQSRLTKLLSQSLANF